MPDVSLKLRVHDTLSRRKVSIRPSPGKGGKAVRLYVCGVTPYDAGHMGHAFTFCTYDILIRYIEASGVRVRYVQNVTDVDDPLFERARRDGVGWRELADRETAIHLREMDLLGWRRPDFMPRVSEEIEPILRAATRLHAGGFAYLTDSLYFDASRYRGYGQLSRRTRLSMIRKLRHEDLLGAVGPGAKRDVLDFPLWRPSAPDEPAWPSQFGEGRPGWHIECSAMAMHYLGEQLDIHGGGRDLAFSHHESERAQSECLTGKIPFARTWMHTGLVRYEGRKMSKSLGNLVLVSQALERAPAAAVRLYLASHRYGRDWEFSWSGLARAALLAARLRALLAGERAGVGPARAAGQGRVGPNKGMSAAGWRLVSKFNAALADDLDTPTAIRVLRAAVRQRDAPAARWMLGILAGTASLSQAPSDRARLAPRGRKPIAAAGDPDSDRRDVPLVVEPPGRVSHQPHRSVSPPPRPRLPHLDRLAELRGRLTRELRERASDRVDDMRIRRAELRGAQAHVQATSQLVENVETGCRVLDLDGIEIELGGHPPHPMRIPTAHLLLRAPERVRGDGEATLLMDRVDGRGGAQARFHRLLQEETDDVPVPARDLLADDNVQLRPAGGIFGSAERPFDGVVVGDRDHIEAGVTGGVLDQLDGARPSVACGRVHVEVGATPEGHRCAS